MKSRSQPLRRTPFKAPDKTGAFNGRNPARGGTPRIEAERRAPARRKDTGPSGKVRRQVWERDCGRCVGCGRVITPGMWWSIQHRLARGQGGTNDLTNLILLCGSATSPGCHRIAEDRDAEYHARGLWLNSWEDPALVPVMVSDGGGGFTAWLTADGRYLFESPAGEVA